METEPPSGAVAVPTEHRDPWLVAVHGAAAGLIAGVALGAVEIVASRLLSGNALLPFTFAAALVVGPAALTPSFPVAAAVVLGTVLHVLLSVFFGVVFVGALALAFQLSARSWLVVLYGVVFGLLVWEVDFMAALPVIAPALTPRLNLSTQLWNGIAAYALVYGPILGVYVATVRPGLLDRWWNPGAPRDR